MPVAVDYPVPPDTLNPLSFLAVAEQCRDLVALLTPTGETTFLNAAGRQMLGTEGTPSLTAHLTEPDTVRFAGEILPACEAQGHWNGVLSFDTPGTARPVLTEAYFFLVPGNNEQPSRIVCNARIGGAAEIERQAGMLSVATRVASDILASQSGIEALEHFAEAARQLTGAQYAAIGVATTEGDGLELFVTDGMTHEQEQTIGKRPHGAGVLGLLLSRTTPLRLNDLSHHQVSVGFPANHPQMNAFLGVPIRHGDTILGSLYLTQKPGGFDSVDEMTVFALGAHLAIAIRNLQMLKRRRALVAGMIAAQEEERRAVAYDLHDGLTQYVMAAQMQFSVFRGALERGEVTFANESLRPAFETGYKYLASSVLESRRLVNKLRSLALDDIGLVGALEQLIAEEKERAGWQETMFTHDVGGERYPQMVETALYRIAQEALTNVRKHAAAKAVQILLTLEAGTDCDQLCLKVSDNGTGFDPSADSTDCTHIGLHGIAERVRLLQGQLEIVSEPGCGTRLVVRLPLLPGEEKA